MYKIEIACQALFAGRMNVAKAAEMSGLSIPEMKEIFTKYVKAQPIVDWSLDLKLCWPYN